MTSQYQPPSSPLGIMRNSTFAMLCCLRPELSIRVNQDTIHCAALRAQKSTQAQLSAARGDIGHLIHRRRISCSELEPSSDSTPRSAEWFPGWQPQRWRRRGAFFHSRRQLFANAATAIARRLLAAGYHPVIWERETPSWQSRDQL